MFCSGFHVVILEELTNSWEEGMVETLLSVDEVFLPGLDQWPSSGRALSISGTLATCPAFLFSFKAAVDNYIVSEPIYCFLQF